MSETQPLELDPGTPEIDLIQVKNRSVSGILSLTSRTFFVQITTFLATLALTVFLSPEIYGIFFLVSSVVNFLTYFSDIGLAAALIQKKSKILREDLTTTFAIQQILVISLLLITILATPFIRAFYSISQSGVYLLYALGISFFLSSLKTIPSILLERRLQFNKLIIPQIAETLVFNFVAVYLAWKGYGITSFTVAVVARGVTGLVLMYLVSPWRPGISIKIESLKTLLKFGLPYQANTFLAVLKDDGMTILLGKIIGPVGLGYIGWASRWANMPLRIFMDNVSKVAFPAFSRLQDNKERLRKAVELNIKYLSLIVFPIFIAMGFLAKPLIEIIPKYTKWLPALIPLYLYLYNASWATVSTSLTNALNAVGKIKVTFKLMLMWVSLTWALMPALAIKYGFVGVSYAAGIIATSSIVAILAAKKHIKFSLVSSLKSPVLSSIGLSLYLILVHPFTTSVSKITIISLGGVVIYIGLVILMEGKTFISKTIKLFALRK
jgi:O-antigen/teichoic acid export membrane protein